jgi:hypothetical protein
MSSEEALWHADDNTGGLPHYVRFRDLKAANIVGNWSILQRLIDEESFPPGVMLGRNTRGWALDQVKAWLAARPVGKKVVHTSAKHVSKTRKKSKAA